ncbi:MAG: nucleoside triphosphate pyrophosphohydrolase [Bdellovibrionales bacterium]|nr:nucleoside triphosphate pyrophosphohydrolase [Bdellovibrionales bacterium]
MPKPPKHTDTFDGLLQIVKDLRGPDGCPWDKEQTHKSLARYAIEEAHELADAIDRNDQDHMVEELGDVLFQVALHSELGRQSGTFDISQVLNTVNTKMIRRHPHVFSDKTLATSEEVVTNWNKIKEEEKKGISHHKQTRFDIPDSLPSTIKAQKIGEKTRKTGFDWSSSNEVLQKIEEEFEELKVALKSGDLKEIQHEIGDLLFSTIQLARHKNLDGDQCLRTTNLRFETRYFKMLELADEESRPFETLTLEEKECFWKAAKKLVP